MAVTASNLTVGNNVLGVTNSNTASVTPVTNNLILLTVSQRTGITVDPNQPTATGNSLTWVVVSSIVFDTTSSSRRRITVLRALGASPTAGVINIDAGGQIQTDFVWSVDQFDGMDLSGTNGSGAIVQAVSAKDETLTASSLSVALANSLVTTNATFGAFGSGNDTDGHVAGSGFSALGVSPGAGINGISATTEFKNSSLTSTYIADMSLSSGVQFGGIGIEILAAAVATNIKNLALSGVG